MSCYTGSMFETEILAECLVVWDNYLPYNQCIELVKKNQPKSWNPADPSSAAGNDLQALIVEALGIDDYDEVKLYTALHSPLDRYHGVDCFIEYQDRRITIDLTVNIYKDAYKADFIISEEDVYDEEGKINLKKLRPKAQAIALALTA